ncbi:MAG: alpha/beta hydrolase [Zavarzinia sp.]|nr:alpha/beta hydrolase [Zavarzinia sp.]
MKVKFIEIDGVMTRLLVEGKETNMPLLLLHGYGGTADLWFRNIDALSDQFYVIAPDLYGSGFNDKPSLGGKPSHGFAVKHLCALIEKLNLRSLALCGSSYGALIACLTYLAMPERVAKLIINGSGSTFNSDEQLTAGISRVLEVYTPLLKEPTLASVRATMDAHCYDPASVPEEIIPVMLTAYAMPGTFEFWLEGIHAMGNLDNIRPFRILDRLEQIEVETLVLWGRQDKGAIYESAVAAIDRMPNARLFTFENCGHKPMFEHAKTYNDVVRTFLTTEAWPGQ